MPSDSSPTAPYEARILALFDGPKAKSLTRSEMARALELSPPERSLLRAALANLVSHGKLQPLKKARYGLPRPEKTSSKYPEVTGIITFQSPRRNRNATIQPDAASLKRVRKLTGQDHFFIHERFSGSALPGDRVLVSLHPAPVPKWQKNAKRHRAKIHRPGEARYEGRVREILHRKRTRFVGLLRIEGKFARVEPDESIFPRPIEVHRAELPPEARNGQKVIVELREWKHPFETPQGRVVRVLGDADDAGVDILSIIHRHELPLEFPRAVAAEAKAIPQTISEEEIGRREDWRGRTVFTIDPADARDFDDAIFVREHDEGWELGVFIADVAHYVKPNSPLDVEARKRGNSVYLVDRVIPMLPEALSNGICSLVPNEERLTHAAIMEFDRKGVRRKARFCKAVIRSQRRFAYEEAFALLEADSPPDQEPETVRFHAELQKAWRLGSTLRKKRMGEGALDLDFPEVRVVLNDDGKPIELKQEIYDISHQLIEEFMLAANEAVAEFTKNKQTDSIYRVHDDPDQDKLFEFRELARAYHYEVGDLSLRPELQKLLRAVRGKPEEHAMKIGLLKSLKRAVYSEEPHGHWGLAKVNYTHFTSPIRRYADLVVHRVLEKHATRPVDKPSIPKKKAMAEIAEHISTTERTAADAENESKLLKMFEYFFHLLDEDEDRVFDAVITEITGRGLFVELKDYFLRGMIRSQDLPRKWDVEPRFQRVTDARGRVALHPGLTVPVRLCHVDLEQKHLDFQLAQ